VSGGSLLAVAAAALWWKNELPGIERATSQQPAAYVDHDGWMLSSKDKQRLTAPRP
jgi:hypothetical protein